MNIAIHSIRGTLYQGTAEKVICRTDLGQMTVLDHHIPLVSNITGPAVDIVDAAGEQRSIPLVSGFIEVRPRSEVVILTN